MNPEKLGSLSGIASVLGSWQVCHNVCLGLIAMLGLIGITLQGMPLLFLTQLAIPFWTVAFLLWIFTLYMYIKRSCISTKMLTLNTGLLIAGFPFFQTILIWIAGGSMVGAAASMHIRDKVRS